MRPYVICHMTISIDGKVTGSFLNREECVTATEEYYRLNREIPAEAFACGRVTMEESFTGGWYPDLIGFANIKMNREDFIADRMHPDTQSHLTEREDLVGKHQRLKMKILGMEGRIL